MVRIVDPALCVRCKGRLWCGLSRCPILEQMRIAESVRAVPLSLNAPSPPGVFVSWKGYPRVEVSPTIALERPELAENPGAWTEMDIESIIRLRTGLLRPYFSVHVDSASNPSYGLVDVQEVALSKRPVDIGVDFLRRPRMRIEFGHEVAPMGPKAPAKRIELQESPRADRLAEKLYYDELRAEDAAWALYSRGRDVYFISRLLSVGALGVPRKRRLVPTRWAITATDDMIYKKLRAEILRNPPVDTILLFQSHLFDNHFFVIFLPDAWSFELLEAWAPGSAWHTGSKTVILSDWEGRKGRKTYADNVGGSYYAARLAVLEKLREMEKQATVVILREVREGYYAPLGVWQVRENVRSALRGRPQAYSSLKELFDDIRGVLRIPPEEWYKRSVLLRRWKEQRRLF